MSSEKNKIQKARREKKPVVFSRRQESEQEVQGSLKSFISLHQYINYEMMIASKLEKNKPSSRLVVVGQ